MITTYLGVFDDKLKHIIKRIKRELEKSKKDRDRETLKTYLREARDLKKSLKKLKKEAATTCPHCGKELP